MGTYKTRCPFCSEKFEVSDEQTGTMGTCPRCQKEFEIPKKLTLGAAASAADSAQSPLAQQTKPDKPVMREASGLRSGPKKKFFNKRRKRNLFVLLLLGVLVGGAYWGLRFFFFEKSGFFLAEESEETQFFVSGHGLFLKAEKNLPYQPPEEEVRNSEKLADQDHGWSGLSYRKVRSSMPQKAQSPIKKLFSKQYSGIVNLPDQNMTWGRLEVKNGKADGTLRLYRFRRGREVMTDEWLFKSGRLIRHFHQPPMGEPRTILIKYDWLGRFEYAVENRKIIARAIYDKYLWLKSIVIVEPTGRIVQTYDRGRVILEKRYSGKSLKYELRYHYTPQGEFLKSEAFDGNGRPYKSLSKQKKIPSLSLLKMFARRELFRQSAVPTHKMPSPQWSPEPSRTIPEKIAEDMTKPVTQLPKTSVDAHPEVAE